MRLSGHGEPSQRTEQVAWEGTVPLKNGGGVPFAADPRTGGYPAFTADNSGPCIDTPGASTASGVRLRESTRDGTPAQASSLVQG